MLYLFLVHIRVFVLVLFTAMTFIVVVFVFMYRCSFAPAAPGEWGLEHPFSRSWPCDWDWDRIRGLSPMATAYTAYGRILLPFVKIVGNLTVQEENGAMPMPVRMLNTR